MTARGARWGLVIVLLLSLALRVVIVLRGGQFFWADEGRYYAAESAWKKWEAGESAKTALKEVMGGGDHLGFKVLMLAPAWVQRHTGGSYLVPAFTVSLFSLLNIFLVWRVARQAGAGEREAFWAAAAMAGANCMFYWARHLMPYDASLTLALLCLSIAVKPEVSWRDSILAGLLGCAAFVTYNGYWGFVAVALAAPVLFAMPRWGDAFKRASGGMVGLAGAFALLLMFDSWVLGVDLLKSYTSFAGTINQGNFDEGALVFFDYLWGVERGTAVVWAMVFIASWGLFFRCDGLTRRRGILWAGGMLTLAAVMIVGANVFEKFVVYGRLARQIAPFAALLVGWMAARIFGEMSAMRGKENLALTVLAVCAAWSMATPLSQDFPVPFHRRAAAYVTTYRHLHATLDPVGTAPEKFRFLYNGFIWPEADRTPQPPHLVLMEARHPLQWRPYLYEGFNRDQRLQIEATDIRMRLILVKD